MEQYIDFSGFQDQAEDSGEANGQHTQHFAHAVNLPLQEQLRGTTYHPSVQPMSCDVKPRLTKEQHDILEAHFQQQHKPSTNIKKGFAETLNVSLDKVNNWFQNRRAKSKQDAKKAAGQIALHQNYSQMFSSDSEPSPYQPSQEYAEMMQHMVSDEHLPSGLGISQAHQAPPQVNGVTFGNDMPTNEQFQGFAWPAGLSEDIFDSTFDVNRRTMTQEQFDAMNRNGGMMNVNGDFETLDASFSGDHDALSQVFPVTGFDGKQDLVGYQYPYIAPPLSSNDSTVPSITSDQSMPHFPSSQVMQSRPSMSTASSDWTESRSSSLASGYHGTMGAPMLPVQQQAQPATSPWEPGKSKPVDVDAMKDQFQQALAQASQIRAMEQPQTFEQPLAWPSDEAYVRRGSTASMLAQSMGNVGIHTPQPNDNPGVFKSPPPATSIAARRQRPKPANLGIASLRSQSLSGPGQPASPGHQHNTAQGHPIRRVMSTNVLNGGVVQGRVMKSVPGSAQRSPLNWNFNDALNSPHLVRAISQSNLAPPTPMSPGHPIHAQQGGNWQNGAGQYGQQPAFSEAEEQGLGGPSYKVSNPMPPHVSPPHTPMWYQQQAQYAVHRVGSNVIMENTPPQSAPASQSCFPSNVFGPPPTSVHQSQHQQMAAIANSQPQQYLNLAVPDQQYQVPNVTFVPSQQANVVASGPPPGAPITFATGVPMMNADGSYQVSFPSQMQMMQPHQSSSPPQMPYAFGNSNAGSPTLMSQPPKLATQPANDLVVHEYTPPESIKRSVTPRKTVDTGIKSYIFANAGPNDYEEKKARSSASPASSNGTASTS